MPQPQSLVKFSAREDSFLAEILRNSKQDVSIVVPDDMEGREVLATIGHCTSSLVKLEHAKGFLIPILGRLMARVAKDKLYEAAGYDTLRAFEQEQILDKGVSRSAVWEARKIYEWAPGLSLEDQAAAGPSKLAMAAQHFPDASPKQKREHVAKAKELTVEKFKEYVEQKSGQEKGATTGAVFELIGNAAQIRTLKEELALPAFVEYAGSDQPIVMILAAIAEVKSVLPVEEDEERRLIHVKKEPKEEPEPEPEINW